MARSEANPLINYTKEAFQLPANLIALGGAAVLTGVLTAVNPETIGIPIGLNGGMMLFLTAGLEALYLALMPQFEPFVRAVNSRKAAQLQRIESKINSLQVLKQLSQLSLQKYYEFNVKKEQIAENLTRQKGAEGVFTDEFRQRFDHLENLYITLLHQLDLYEQYKEHDHKADWTEELNNLKAQVEQSTGRVREMHLRRLNLLQKREQKAEKVVENLEVARIQLATLEDTLNFLLEQSLSVHSVAEFNRTVDNLLEESEHRTESLAELQDLLEFDSSSFTNETSGSSSSAGRVSLT
jgi:hypothetical protein